MPAITENKKRRHRRRSSSIMIFNFCLFCWKGIRSERITVWFMLHLRAIKLNACDILISFNPRKISHQQVEVNGLFVRSLPDGISGKNVFSRSEVGWIHPYSSRNQRWMQ